MVSSQAAWVLLSSVPAPSANVQSHDRRGKSDSDRANAGGAPDTSLGSSVKLSFCNNNFQSSAHSGTFLSLTAQRALF